ncbi:universal stress protein [Asanoa iriomotensis]|uniref:Universal stress protein n=1 Tax=Asanoa iriomotensis TaxID=234613 RepID=A0ABQ4CCP1_9ACTN|nr:universal stress protein [Asanoa iriomotensis]GIF60525.1 universal stress protein [Asanoa iriomotensis]
MATRVLMGFDGSPPSTAAIDAGARLFPGARAWIAHLWAPPFADARLRDRLRTGTRHVDDFAQALEREGEREANRTAGVGVILARAVGWDAEPLVVRSYGGEGLALSDLAEKLDPDLVLVGSRGLGGAEAVLGSVSDTVAHHSPRPVLVMPHPLLTAEYAALTDGPVLVAFDGSDGARTALATAERLFDARRLELVTVDDDQPPEDDAAGPGSAPVTRLHVAARPGPPGRAVAAALAGCARDRSAAALVVGSRGRSAMREILLGSVAMATLHHAGRPVLVVPAPTDD